MKMIEIIIHFEVEITKGIMGRGSRMAISTSKIKKMIAIMKKRKENGIREVENGENPHSKGEVFSRSRLVFFPRRVAVIIIVSAKTKIAISKLIKINISSPG